MDEAAYQQRKTVCGWLKEFAEVTDNCFYIDTLENPYIAGRKDIFIEDGIHFNAEGYRLYAQIFKEALAEELEQY